MNEMIVKEFEGKKVRTHLDENGIAWFSSQDIMDVLGLKYKNSAMKRIYDAERGSFRSSTPGGIQDISAVNESGMYKLIIRSDKPNAQKMIDWITSEVLPSIRKTGSYSIEKELSPLDILENHVRQMRALEAKNVQMAKQITVVDNKVDKMGTTLNQLMMHRKGTDPVPRGTMPVKRIRQMYFKGVSTEIISEFLTEKDHPKTPYTYVGPNGTDHSSFSWQEDGLADLYKELIVTSSYIKATPQKLMFSNPLLANNFGFKIEELSPDGYRLIISRIELEEKRFFKPISTM